MSSSAAAKCARTVITRPSDVCLLRTRSTPRVTCSSPQLRQRPSGFSSWFGASFRPSLSVGARQSERTGGVVSRVWPSNRIAVSRPPSVSKSTSVRSRVGVLAWRAALAAGGQRDLLPADREPLRCPAEIDRGLEVHGEERFLARRGLGVQPRDLDGLGLAGGDVGKAQRTVLHDLAVDRDLVAGAEPRDAGEVLHVAQADDAALEVALRRAHADRAREVPVLLQRGLRCAVGPDHAVDAEVHVVGLITEIAAVRGAGGAVGELSGGGRGPRTPR